MDPLLVKQSEINSGLNVSELILFMSVHNVQCTDSNNLSACDNEAREG